MNGEIISIERLMKLIPHRYPMLLVDKLIDIQEDSAIGLKNVTINEPFFQGHFPVQPVMPGVLIIESMAQTAGVYVMNRLGEEAGNKIVYFMSIEDGRFRKPVVPGDTLYIHIKKERNRGQVWKFSGEVKVEDKVVAEATYSAMIMDTESRK